MFSISCYKAAFDSQDIKFPHIAQSANSLVEGKLSDCFMQPLSVSTNCILNFSKLLQSVLKITKKNTGKWTLKYPNSLNQTFQTGAKFAFLWEEMVFTHEGQLIYMYRIHFLPLCCTQQMSHESSQQVSLEYQPAEFLNKKLKQSMKRKY